MKYEWIDVNKEQPPLNKIIKVKYRVNVPGYNIKVGDIRKSKLVLHDPCGLVLKLDVKSKQDGFATLEDIFCWLRRMPVPVKNRWEILDL